MKISNFLTFKPVKSKLSLDPSLFGEIPFWIVHNVPLAACTTACDEQAELFGNIVVATQVYSPSWFTVMEEPVWLKVPEGPVQT